MRYRKWTYMRAFSYIHIFSCVCLYIVCVRILLAAASQHNYYYCALGVLYIYMTIIIVVRILYTQGVRNVSLVDVPTVYRVVPTNDTRL